RWVYVRTRPNLTRGYVAAEFLILAGAVPASVPTSTRPVPTPTVRLPSAPILQNPTPTTPSAPTTTPVTLRNGQAIQPPTRTSGRSYLDVVNGTSRDSVV